MNPPPPAEIPLLPLPRLLQQQQQASNESIKRATTATITPIKASFPRVLALDFIDDPLNALAEETLLVFASCTKLEKVLLPDVGALMLNTMPERQWPVWPQYPHIGVVSLIVI